MLRSDDGNFCNRTDLEDRVAIQRPIVTLVKPTVRNDAAAYGFTNTDDDFRALAILVIAAD